MKILGTIFLLSGYLLTMNAALKGVGRVAAFTAGYFIFGTVTSVCAALFGTVFVLVALFGPAGAFSIFFPLSWIGLLIGLALSVPVTFAVLPVIALFLTRRRSLALLALGLGGLISGALVTQYWTEHTSWRIALEERGAYIGAGALAGLVAGMLYWKLLRVARG